MFTRPTAADLAGNRTAPDSPPAATSSPRPPSVRVLADGTIGMSPEDWLAAIRSAATEVEAVGLVLRLTREVSAAANEIVVQAVNRQIAPAVEREFRRGRLAGLRSAAARVAKPAVAAPPAVQPPPAGRRWKAPL